MFDYFFSSRVDGDGRVRPRADGPVLQGRLEPGGDVRGRSAARTSPAGDH